MEETQEPCINKITGLFDLSIWSLAAPYIEGLKPIPIITLLNIAMKNSKIHIDEQKNTA
ncbi:hypothetical protein [Paenisporosarcina indica]|uniref:hypothetical protein n=1 Tax=Paenisporosarcina indica TaxID=650093 RepID=UPI000A5A78DA|nr:hypothetical protein [Paenisporosarcina indica]